MGFVSNLFVTSTPAPEDEEWHRLGRLPGPVYLWYTIVEVAEGALSVIDAFPRQQVDNPWHIVDFNLSKVDSSPLYLAFQRTDAKDLAITDLKLCLPDEAAGQGFVRVEHALSLKEPQFLCYRTNSSLAESLSLGFDIKVGDVLDAKDRVQKWCVATVVEIDQIEKRIFVRYEGWSDKWNDWVDLSPDSVAKYRTHSQGYTGSSTNKESSKLSGDSLEEFYKIFQEMELLIEQVKGEGIEVLECNDTSTFIQQTVFDQVQKLLDILVDDRSLLVKVVQFFKMVLFLFNQCIHTSSLNKNLLLFSSVRIFNGDPNFRRFYSRYGTVEKYEGSETFAKQPSKDRIVIKETVSRYLVEVVDYFGTIGGFDRCEKVLMDGLVPLADIPLLIKLVLSADAVFSPSFRTEFPLRMTMAIVTRCQLENVSDDDVKSVERQGIIDIFQNLRVLMELIPKDILSKKKKMELTEDLRLQVPYRFLKSPFLAKRIFGLSQICEIIDSIEASRIPFALLTEDYIIQWMQEKDLLKELLGHDVHQEILKRIPEILKFLASHEALTDNNLITLWRSSLNQHEVIVRTIYQTISTLFAELSQSQIDLLFSEISALKFSQFTDFTLSFVKQFTLEALIRSQKSGLTTTKWYGLDIFFELALDDSLGSSELKDTSFKYLLEFLEHDSCYPRKLEYLSQMLGRLKRGETVPRLYQMMHDLLATFGDESEGDALSKDAMICQLEAEDGILNLVLQDLKQYLGMVKPESMPADIQYLLEYPFVNDISHRQQVLARLGFFNFIFQSSSIFLTYSLFNRISEVLMAKAKDANLILLLSSLEALLSSSDPFLCIEADEMRQIFQQFICKAIVPSNPSFDSTALKCFQKFFLLSNVISKKLVSVHSGILFEVIDPRLDALEHLWDIIAFAPNQNSSDAIYFLVALMMNASHQLAETSQVWSSFLLIVIDKLQIALKSEGNIPIRPFICVFDTFLKGLESRLVIDPSSSYDLSPSRIDVEFSFYENAYDLCMSSESQVESQHSLGYLRQSLAKKEKVSSNKIRLVHRNESISRVLWSIWDSFTLKELHISDGDEIAVYPLKQKEKLENCLKSVDDVNLLLRFLSDKEEYTNLLFELLDADADSSPMLWLIIQRIPKETLCQQLTNDIKSKSFEEWGFPTSSLLRFYYYLEIAVGILGIHSNVSNQMINAFIKNKGIVLCYKAITDWFSTKQLLETELSVQCFGLTLSLMNFTQMSGNRDLSFVEETKFFDFLVDVIYECYQQVDIKLRDGILDQVFRTMRRFLSRDCIEKRLKESLLLNKVIESALNDKENSNSVFDGLVSLCSNSLVASFFLSRLIAFLKAHESVSLQEYRVLEFTDKLLELAQNRDWALDLEDGIFNLFFQRILSEETKEPTLQLLFRICSILAHREDLPADTTSHIIEIVNSCLFSLPCAISPENALKYQTVTPRCKSKESRSSAYSFLLQIMPSLDPGFITSLSDFLSDQNHICSHSAGKRPSDFDFSPLLDERSCYVGIRNPGCVCYMISLIQLLFMVPQIRLGVLGIETEEDPESFFYQLQYLFAYLQESETMFADILPFCNAFKDWDGSPTNISVQKDTNEFMNMLFDRIDTKLKSTPNEKLLQNILGGQFSNQLFGISDCQHQKERLESFYCVTLGIKNKTSVIAALESFIEGETLAGDNAYLCSECDKKVDTMKRTVLKDLPDTMILHLKRFELDFDTMEMIKINDYCEFPDEIDFYPFSAEGISENETITESGGKRPKEYYQYFLSGILIHAGHANAGHYYSFIKSDQWYEFNDHFVKPFDPSMIPSEAFGGSEVDERAGREYTVEKNRNAYLLFYTRKGVSADIAIKARSDLLKGIRMENIAFWRDKYVFDPRYHSFLSSFVKYAIDQHPDNIQVLSSITKLSTLFTCNTLSRCSQKSDFLCWIGYLETLVRHSDCSLVFVKVFLEHPQLVQELFLQCPYYEIRRSFGFLLVESLSSLYKQGKDDEVKQLMDILVSLLSTQIGQFWSRFGCFFWILCSISEMDRMNPLLTVKLDNGRILYHLLSCMDSSLIGVYNTQLDASGNHITQWGTEWSPVDLFHFLRLLQNTLQSTDTTDEIFWESQFISKLITQATNKQRGDLVSAILHCICKSDRRASEVVLELLAEGIEVSDSILLRCHFRVLCGLVSKFDGDSVSRYLSAVFPVVKMNEKYWSATLMGIDILTKMIQHFPLVRDWFKQENSKKRIIWMKNWLAKFGDGNNTRLAKSNLQMSKPGYRNAQGRYGWNHRVPIKRRLSTLADISKLESQGDVSDSDEGICHHNFSLLELNERVFSIGDKIKVLDRFGKECSVVVEEKTFSSIRANPVSVAIMIPSMKSAMRWISSSCLRYTLPSKSVIESFIVEKGFAIPAFEIYGGSTGLYDLGPRGTLLMDNLVRQWKQSMLLDDDIEQVSCSIVTPEKVLEASGHAAKFSDLMVKDLVNGQCFRADKLLAEVLSDRLNEEGVKQMVLQSESMTADEMKSALKKFNIKSPCGNELSDPFPFNLMFKTQLGSLGESLAYLRPETAQGIFTHFRRLLQLKGGNLPFGTAQIGTVFRNEISPRSGLLRLREFLLAELEYYYDPNTDLYHLTNEQDILVSVLEPSGNTIELNPKQLFAKGYLSNPLLLYFIEKSIIFLQTIGIRSEYMRLRQHSPSELAHYASDCWDIEILTSRGWIEVVGIADRSCFDLESHSKASGIDLSVKRPLSTERTEIVHSFDLNRKLIASTFTQMTGKVMQYLDQLDKEGVMKLMRKVENGSAEIVIDDNPITITREMLNPSVKTVAITEESFFPSVIEPSFGMHRIFLALIEHSFCERLDDGRTVLSLPPTLSPLQVVVLPISNKTDLIPLTKSVCQSLKRIGISARMDTSSGSIGKRYSRADEVGVPFAVTIDFDSLHDNCVTIRERDSAAQIRIAMDLVAETVQRFLLGGSFQ